MKEYPVIFIVTLLSWGQNTELLELEGGEVYLWLTVSVNPTHGQVGLSRSGVVMWPGGRQLHVSWWSGSRERREEPGRDPKPFQVLTLVTLPFQPGSTSKCQTLGDIVSLNHNIVMKKQVWGCSTVQKP